MNTQATTTPRDLPEIPASIKREPAPTTPASAKIAEKHNADVKAPKRPVSSVLRDALQGAAVTVTTKEQRAADKAAPAPKATKEQRAADKAAKAASKHKPTTVASTEQNPSKSIVPARFKERYADHNGTNGTKLALALKAATSGKNADGRDCLDLEKLAAVATQNGIDPAVYNHLNNGQKRMNVGNKLRGLLKAGKKVTIGETVFADAAKALAVQPVEQQPAA